MHRVEVRNIVTYLINKKISRLAIDLITDFLRAERYPDPKVMQIELSSMGLYRESQCRRLLRDLWSELLDEQESAPTKKYKLCDHKVYSGTSEAKKSVSTR